MHETGTGQEWKCEYGEMECGFGAPQQHTARWIQESELGIRPKASFPIPLLDINTHMHTVRYSDRRSTSTLETTAYSIKRSITQSREHWRSDWGNTIIALPFSNISEWFPWDSTYLWPVHGRVCIKMRTVLRSPWHIFSVLLKRQHNYWNAMPLPVYLSGTCRISFHAK